MLAAGGRLATGVVAVLPSTVLVEIPGSVWPLLGLTTLPKVSDAAAAIVPELLEPSAPQAARANVARAQRTQLRMAEPAEEFVINHYPGKTLNRSPGQRVFTRAHDHRSPIAIRITTTSVCGVCR